MMNITLGLAVLCNVFMLLDESKLSYDRTTHRGLRDTLTALGISLCIASVLRLLGYYMMWFPTWTGDSLVRRYQRRVRKARKQKFQFAQHADVVHDFRQEKAHRRGHFFVAFGQSLVARGRSAVDSWVSFVEVRGYRRVES
jgi:branched-subunit amino acid ABC-type transport system permease component